VKTRTTYEIGGSGCDVRRDGVGIMATEVLIMLEHRERLLWLLAEIYDMAAQGMIPNEGNDWYRKAADAIEQGYRW
jgi:hypothetical protein